MSTEKRAWSIYSQWAASTMEKQIGATEAERAATRALLLAKMFELVEAKLAKVRCPCQPTHIGTPCTAECAECTNNGVARTNYGGAR